MSKESLTIARKIVAHAVESVFQREYSQATPLLEQLHNAFRCCKHGAIYTVIRSDIMCILLFKNMYFSTSYFFLFLRKFLGNRIGIKKDIKDGLNFCKHPQTVNPHARSLGVVC